MGLFYPLSVTSGYRPTRKAAVVGTIAGVIKIIAKSLLTFGTRLLGNRPTPKASVARDLRGSRLTLSISLLTRRSPQASRPAPSPTALRV